MEIPKVKWPRSIIEEAEFMLDDKILVIDSPKTSKKQVHRGHISSLRTKMKGKEHKCLYCSFVFIGKSLLLSHMKVCTHKSKKCKVDPHNALSLMNGALEVDDNLLHLLRSAISSKLVNNGYIQHIERIIQKFSSSSCK